MEPPRLSGEPFKATKLWNLIIQEFRTGMPLKRHRRGLRGRHYDNCFTSNEAIDWLHGYLQGCDRFGPWVTRAQTISLLEKFLHSKVIQGVKGSGKDSPGSFEDNGDLYRFVHVSPIKKLRSALSSRSNLRSARTPLKTINSEPVGRALSYDNPGFSVQDAEKEGRRPPAQAAGKAPPERRLVQKALPSAQREEVWKRATLNRLQRLLWLTTLDNLLDAGLVSARHILHNCTHISRNGVVLVAKDQDDLPHWVLSAMKCLANWPNSPDSDLPNYPGFERDVFKTISNYFLSLPQPLLTHHLYHLVVESFVTAERRDRGLYPGAESMSNPPPETMQGLTSFQSVENLMLNMTSGGVFGRSPELAGAPERQVRGGIAGTGRCPDEAVTKRLKMMDGRRWIGDVRGIPPSCAVSHSHAETGKGQSPAESSNQGWGMTRPPPALRGQRGVQRSCSMSVTDHARPWMERGGHQQPLVGDGRRLHTQPQGMRRCISEPTTGHHALSKDSPSRGLTECQPRPASSRTRHERRRDQEPPKEEIHGMRNPQPQPRQRPESAPVQQHTTKFPSTSDLHAQDNQQQEFPGLVNGSRKFTSQIILDERSNVPAVSTQRPQANFQSRDDCPQMLTSVSSKDLNYGFPMQYPDPPGNNQRGFGSMNDLGKAANPFPKDYPAKESTTRNLFVSKKFGSASELISRIFKKKGNGGDADPQRQSHHSFSLGHQLRGSTPNLPLQAVQKPLRPPDRATPSNPASASSIKSDQQERISPSYPPPLRATLSYSDVNSSREGGSGHTPESSAQVDRLRSVSSADVRSVGVQTSEETETMKRSDSTASLYLSDDKSYTEEALRLCCLLLPPVNRRKVHLLLKLMAKMDNNPLLVLSSRKTTRQLVLQTFSRAILCSENEIDYNEALSSRIVEYLMDNYGNVFSQPEDLKADVEDRLAYLRRSQIKYVTASENQKPAAPSYCQKVTVAEYEAQKMSHSQKAIADLLEVIIRDHSMPAKDKKKKLKQFQKTYPDIYARRLPTTASEAELLPEKPKIKQSMTNVRKSFSKLKSLR